MTNHRRVDGLARRRDYACPDCRGTGVRLPISAAGRDVPHANGHIADQMGDDMIDLAGRIADEALAEHLAAHPISGLPEPLRTAAESGDDSYADAARSYLAAVGGITTSS